MAGRARRRPGVVGKGDGEQGETPALRDAAGETRPRHGARKRCSDPHERGCRGFARRHSDKCSNCGGGSRTGVRYNTDPDSGEVTRKRTGRVDVPPRVAALLDGEIDVADLDEEELAHGYPRAEDGSFRGPPAVIPRAMYNRMHRELFERANRELRTGLVDTAQYMMKVVKDDRMDPKLRLDAAKWVFERMMGKVPDVTVQGDARKYEEVFEGIDRNMPSYGEPEDDGREA